MGHVDLLAAQVQCPCRLVENGVVARFAGFSQREQVAQHAFAAQQGGGHGVRHGQQLEGRFHGNGQHHIQQREDAHHEGLVGFFRGHALQRQQFHQPAAHHGGLAHRRRRCTRACGREQQGRPAEQLFQPQQHHGLAEGGDLPVQPKPGRVDEAHEVERQTGIFLQHLFNIVGAGLLAHQVDEVDDAGLCRREQLGLHQRGAREPVALEQLHPLAGNHVVLLGCLDLLGNQLRLAVACGVADQHGQLVRGQHRQIQLDVVGQGQPGGVSRFEHGVVEGEVKAAITQAHEDGQARFHLLRSCVAQRRNLQHHLVGVQQFQVAAREAFVGAVHKNQLLADQLFRARMRQRCEHQNHIGGGGVPDAGARTVEQLIANHCLLGIDDGLARDHGHSGLPRCVACRIGRCIGGCSGHGWLLTCERFKRCKNNRLILGSAQFPGVSLSPAAAIEVPFQ